MTEDRLSGLAMLLIHRETGCTRTPTESYDMTVKLEKNLEQSNTGSVLGLGILIPKPGILAPVPSSRCLC